MKKKNVLLKISVTKKWKVKNTLNKVIFSSKVTKNVTLYFLENVLILSYFQRSFVLWKSSDEFGSHWKMLRLWTLECSELVTPWKVREITSRYSRTKIYILCLKKYVTIFHLFQVAIKQTHHLTEPVLFLAFAGYPEKRISETSGLKNAI
jgi:hypothetical protein